MDNTKISIRFFNDREVRAIWDEANSKWWFSVLDVVAVLNDQADYNKVRNYWKYLKAKLKKEQNELVSVTTQLKLRTPDGKLRLTDTLDSNGVIMKKVINLLPPFPEELLHLLRTFFLHDPSLYNRFRVECLRCIRLETSFLVTGTIDNRA